MHIHMRPLSAFRISVPSSNRFLCVAYDCHARMNQRGGTIDETSHSLFRIPSYYSLASLFRDIPFFGDAPKKNRRAKLLYYAHTLYSTRVLCTVLASLHYLMCQIVIQNARVSKKWRRKNTWSRDYSSFFYLFWQRSCTDGTNPARYSRDAVLV